jgi:hypothetical protein
MVPLKAVISSLSLVARNKSPARKKRKRNQCLHSQPRKNPSWGQIRRLDFDGADEAFSEGSVLEDGVVVEAVDILPDCYR